MLPYDANHPFMFSQGSDLTFPLHHHKEVELVFLTAGEMMVTVGRFSRTLCAGEAAFIFPYALHSYLTEESSRFTLMIFSTDLIPDFEESLLAKQPALPYIGMDRLHPDVGFLLHALVNNGPEPIDRSLLKGYLHVLVYRLLEQIDLVCAAEDISLDLPSRVLRMINDHYQESLNLEVLSRQLGCSKYHLSRLFMKKIGISLRDYINALRIEHAKVLLSNPALSVTEVGFEAGFESLNTFFRTFREHCQATPREFRESLREGMGGAN